MQPIIITSRPPSRKYSIVYYIKYSLGQMGHGLFMLQNLFTSFLSFAYLSY